MMAELLIMAVNKTHADPAQDAMSYKRGDIVDVFEDGKLQNPPKSTPFILVRVTGVSKAQVEKYIKSHLTLKTVSVDVTPQDWQRMQKANDPDVFYSMPSAIGTRTDTKGDWVTLEGQMETYATRRKFRLRVDDLPLSVVNTLKRDRAITVTARKMKRFLRNKITNVDEA